MSTYESFIGFIRAAGKVLTISNSGTLAGGDGYTLAIAASKTLTVSNTTTIAGGDSNTLAIAASKTLTVSNTLTLAGTDSTTMTFPATSQTVAGLGTTQSWTAPQRADQATVTDGTLDLNDAQNFLYTPPASDTLEFSNEAAGQSGFIRLVNGSNYTITLGSEIEAPDGMATTLSATGNYVLSYWVRAAGGGADTVSVTFATVV